MPDLGVDIVSDGGNDGFTIPEPTFNFGDPVIESPGSVIDAEIIDDPIAKEIEDRDLDREPKTGPPNATEWFDFFSRVILETATNYYLDWAFRGIDEDLLSEREIQRLQLSDKERKAIARPLAEFSAKSKFMRRHGRTIVSSADSFYSLVILGAWFRRVNSIASKYRKIVGPQGGRNIHQAPQPQFSEMSDYVGPGQSEGAGYYQGTTGGNLNGGYPIVPGTS